jgi:hypothetical protein
LLISLEFLLHFKGLRLLDLSAKFVGVFTGVVAGVFSGLLSIVSAQAA